MKKIDELNQLLKEDLITGLAMEFADWSRDMNFKTNQELRDKLREFLNNAVGEYSEDDFEEIAAFFDVESGAGPDHLDDYL